MKKDFLNRSNLILVLICLIYFGLRLLSLTLMPVFADEAIYIRWAQIAKAEESLRFISLQDGKTPLFMWLMAPFLVFFSDPLLAGRTLSVISGFVTLLGVYFLGKRFFNKQVGLWGAFLMATTPYMVFYDRMALVDSMLAAFTVWILYFGLKLTQTQQIKDAILLGIIAGGGWLTKTPGLVNLAMMPFLLGFFNFSQKKVLRPLVKYGSLFALSGFIAVSLYLIQRIDPNFHMLSARNSDYLHPLSRLLQYPFDPFIPHFKNTIDYFWSLFGLPLILLIPGALILPFLKKSKVGLLLFVWGLIPFVYELQFIKAFTARYILFTIPILLVLIAWEIDWLVNFLSKRLKSINVTMVILFILLIWPIYFSTKLLTDPASAPLAVDEREGYLEGWTAGYGLKEIADYLIEKSQNETIIVGTEGSFGTLPDGLMIYLDNYYHAHKVSNIVVLGGKSEISETVRNFSAEKPTYFVANRSIEDGYISDVKLIKKFDKPVGPRGRPQAVFFYQVYPLSAPL